MKKIILTTKDGNVLDLEYSNLKDLRKLFKEHDITINTHCSLPDVLPIGYGVTLGTGVKIGKNSVIKNNVRIDDEVTIGDNSTINDNIIIETGVKIGSNVTIIKNNIIGEEAIIDDNTTLKNSFYIKTAKSNMTYCGNNKVSIGCQLFTVDVWLAQYSKVAGAFNYTESEIQECLTHMKFIKNNK